MSTRLAAILGLCALTTPSVAIAVFQAEPAKASQKTQPQPVAASSNSPQDSPQDGAPPSGEAPPSPPSANPQTTPAPEATQQPQDAKPPASSKEPESQTPDTPAPGTQAPAPQAKAPNKKRRHRKPAAMPPTATPEKKVVRNGGTTDPAVQLAPSISPEQASNQRQNTTELLSATDANLKQISSRPMNSSQQDSISQIRKYIEQAKAAEQAGDVERAHNLASKALLLSNDLVKP